MLYKPNFCCHCGEKRTDWNMLTSRRFCEACAAENKRHDRIPQVTFASGLLAIMFGLGTMFGGARNQPIPVQTLNASPVHSKPETSAAKPAENVETSKAGSVSPRSIGPTPRDIGPPPAAENETPVKIYYCGALTKKGTPCSRKVKASGSRCYQHEGKSPTGPGA
jgi:hypothetical protein